MIAAVCFSEPMNFPGGVASAAEILIDEHLKKLSTRFQASATIPSSMV